MAIKSFTFSFKLDTKDLLEFITEHDIAVNIEALDTKPQVSDLPAPKKRELTIPGTIISFLIRHKEGASTEALKALLIQAGYSEKSLNNQLFTLRQNGLVKSIGRGKYQATARAKASMVAEHDY
jgi:hypothetical protein